METRIDRERSEADLSRRSFLGHAMALVAWPGSLVGSHLHAAPASCDDCTRCTSRFCRFRVADLAKQDQR
jgi:hypothetical protein